MTFRCDGRSVRCLDLLVTLIDFAKRLVSAAASLEGNVTHDATPALHTVHIFHEHSLLPSGIRHDY
jgi:hypothetical protein